MARPSSTPRLDRTVTLADGRSIAFAEWGPADGSPVVLFHGMPGSRLLCPDADATGRAGVRLVTIDRPGYGGSSPHPGRTMNDWADDFAEWAELIGLPPCPLLGWSGGGPYALACAVHQPERVTVVGLLASLAPIDEVPSEWDQLGDEVRDLTERLRQDQPAALDGIATRCAWFATDWATIFDPVTPSASGGEAVDPDDDLVRDPEVLTPLLDSMREGARQGSVGYVEDWIADALPWGFSPAEVTQAVHVWWGDGDQLVTRACAEHLAGAVARSTLTILPGVGHLFPIQHWDEVLAGLR